MESADLTYLGGKNASPALNDGETIQLILLEVGELLFLSMLEVYFFQTKLNQRCTSLQGNILDKHLV